MEDTIAIPSQDRAEARTEVLQPSIAAQPPSIARRLSPIVDGSPSFATTSLVTAPGAIRTNLQDEARIEIEATERAASLFYSAVNTPRASLPRPIIPPNRIRSGQDDLMLFCDPPPWDILKTMEPPEITNSGRLRTSRGDLATVGWSNGKGTKGMQALAKMVKMRQQYTTSGSTAVIANEPKIINPFRQRYLQEATTPSVHRATNLASSSGAPLPPKHGSTPSLAQKALRPCSTLDIPVLSEEICSEKRKSHTLAPEPLKRRKVANTHTTKEATKHSPISKPRMRSSVADLLRLSPAPSVSRSSSKNVIKASGSQTGNRFDWKKWGNS